MRENVEGQRVKIERGREKEGKRVRNRRKEDIME